MKIRVYVTVDTPEPKSVTDISKKEAKEQAKAYAEEAVLDALTHLNATDAVGRILRDKK